MRLRYEDKTKVCRLRSLIWETAFCLFSFLSKSIWCVGLILWKLLLCNCLSVQTLVNCCCCREKQGQEKTAPYQDKRPRTGKVITFLGFSPFSNARTFFFCFQVIFLKKTIGLCFEILLPDIFLCFAGFLRRDLLYLRRGT